MIYDKLENIEHYLGINKNLDIAIQYILAHDIHSLSVGRTDIADASVYCNVMVASAGNVSEKKYEIHKNYMDIQIDLSGTEEIHIGDSSTMQITCYESDNDFGVVDCKRIAACTIGPGNFIICMAHEPHMPGIAVSEDVNLKKCVFKVRVV